MKGKRVLYITLAVGILIGSSLAVGSWHFRVKKAQAQSCVQLYLDACLNDSGLCDCAGLRSLGNAVPVSSWSGYNGFMRLCAMENPV